MEIIQIKEEPIDQDFDCEDIPDYVLPDMIKKECYDPENKLEDTEFVHVKEEIDLLEHVTSITKEEYDNISDDNINQKRKLDNDQSGYTVHYKTKEWKTSTKKDQLNRVFLCNDCDFESNQERTVQKHVLVHKYLMYVTFAMCKDCNFQSRDEVSTQNHLMVHENLTKVKMYGCRSCTFESKNIYVIRQHILAHHDDVKASLFICNVCTYQSNHKQNLRRHVMHHNKVSKVINCSQSNFKANNERSFNSHMLITIHTCKMCGYQTKHNSNYRAHLLIHINVLPEDMYKCGKCEFRSKHKGSVQRHQLQHKGLSEVKMYECDVCTFRSKYKHSYEIHMLRHGVLAI